MLRRKVHKISAVASICRVSIEWSITSPIVCVIHSAYLFCIYIYIFFLNVCLWKGVDYIGELLRSSTHTQSTRIIQFFNPQSQSRQLRNKTK